MRRAESGQLALNVVCVLRWFGFHLAERFSSGPPSAPCAGPAGPLLDARQRPHWHESLLPQSLL